MHPVITVAAAGFEQQDPVFRVGGKPVGKDAARGAGADDDEIVTARIGDRLVHIRVHAATPAVMACIAESRRQIGVMASAMSL